MAYKKARQALMKDIGFIFIGVFIALVLVKTGALEGLLSVFGSGIFASFVAGIFFTSVFTIAPSSVVLAGLAESVPIHSIAIWGALGALCGDIILFFFIKDRFAEDLRRSLKPSFLKHIFSSFHLGFMKWLSPVLGALIIASPLPDELGLTLMGMSKVRLAILIPVSFAMNAVGIYALLLLTNLV